MAFELRPGHPLGAEILRVLQEEIREAVAGIDDTRLPVAERAHRGRVACKKIRAILRLIRFRHPARCRRADAFLRTSARQISALREAGAVRCTFDYFLRHTPKAADPRSAREARQMIRQADHSSPRAGSRTRLTLGRFEARMLRLTARFGKWTLDDGDFELIVDGLADTYRQARHAFARLSADSPSGFHVWRKRAKAHGYHLRLLRLAWPGVMTRWEKAVDELGECLGHEHDLAVLQTRIRQPRKAAAAPAMAALLDAIESERFTSRTKALALGAWLFAERPSAMRRRLSRWWLASSRPAPMNVRGEEITHPK